jgi:hypothetical protein
LIEPRGLADRFTPAMASIYMPTGERMRWLELLSYVVSLV